MFKKVGLKGGSPFSPEHHPPHGEKGSPSSREGRGRVGGAVDGGRSRPRLLAGAPRRQPNRERR